MDLENIDVTVNQGRGRGGGRGRGRGRGRGGRGRGRGGRGRGRGRGGRGGRGGGVFMVVQRDYVPPKDEDLTKLVRSTEYPSRKRSYPIQGPTDRNIRYLELGSSDDILINADVNNIKEIGYFKLENSLKKINSTTDYSNTIDEVIDSIGMNNGDFNVYYFISELSKIILILDLSNELGMNTFISVVKSGRLTSIVIKRAVFDNVQNAGKSTVNYYKNNMEKSFKSIINPYYRLPTMPAPPSLYLSRSKINEIVSYDSLSENNMIVDDESTSEHYNLINYHIDNFMNNSVSSSPMNETIIYCETCGTVINMREDNYVRSIIKTKNQIETVYFCDTNCIQQKNFKK